MITFLIAAALLIWSLPAFAATPSAIRLPVSQPRQVLHSPRGTEQYSGTPMRRVIRKITRAIPVPGVLLLEWDYPLNRAKLLLEQVGFVVEISTDCVTWKELARVDASPLFIIADQANSFFRVGAYAK